MVCVRGSSGLGQTVSPAALNGSNCKVRLGYSGAPSVQECVANPAPKVLSQYRSAFTPEARASSSANKTDGLLLLPKSRSTRRDLLPPHTPASSQRPHPIGPQKSPRHRDLPSAQTQGLRQLPADKPGADTLVHVVPGHAAQIRHRRKEPALHKRACGTRWFVCQKHAALRRQMSPDPPQLGIFKMMQKKVHHNHFHGRQFPHRE
jgi:hypothetical protein